MMDTSERYIKMCEKAEEIQQGYWKHANEEGYPKHERQDFLKTISFGHTIWLPRQDQLQEMMMLNIPLKETASSLLGFVLHLWGKGSVLQSWEQLWMAFVMKEKYGKIWNGEDWKVT